MGFPGCSTHYFFKALWIINIQCHSFTQPTHTPGEPVMYWFFSLDTNCTKITITLVQVFPHKKTKMEGEHLEHFYSEGRMTHMWVIANEGWIPIKYSSVVDVLEGAGSRNLSKCLIMSRFYSSRYIGPLLFTCQYFWCQSRWVTSCALTMQLPSCLHHRLHSWAWHAFPTPTPCWLPILLLILAGAA